MEYNEYIKIKDLEKDLPIQKRWFKHKETNQYEYRINIFELNDYYELNDYDEII